MSKYSNNMPPDLKDAIGWLYDYVKPGSRFLDFGCATGYFGSILKKDKNCTVDGVEISEDVIEARKVLDKVYSFDLEAEWPEEIFKNKYDFAFFGDVLEHLKNPAEALKKTAKLLRKNGKVFVSIPNISHLSIRLELMQGNFEYETMGILDNTHLKYFTLSSFSKLSEEAGYKVVHVDYTVNEYPKEVTQKLLQKVGLVPNDKFWDVAKSNEARAFQLKFVLQPKHGLSARRKKTRIALPPKPEQYKDNYIEDLNSQISALKKHADEQAAVMANQDHQIRLLQKDLHRHREQVKRIYNSIPGKFYKTAVRAKNKVVRKTASKKSS